MSTFVALLRAVNVGGTGKIPMARLRTLCGSAGFADARTYIASGNVVFEFAGSAARARHLLEEQLHGHFGRPVPVTVRSAREIAAVLAANPFPDGDGSRIHVYFFEGPVPPGAVDDARGRHDEQLRPGLRELYVFYPQGMGASRLRIPATREATARNLNTVGALAAMAARPR